MKKFLAFTLGEILIALSVIGVVAVLVMPSVVIGQKAAKAKAQFNTAYAQIAKAVQEMDANGTSTDPNKYKTAGSFYPELKKYMKVTNDCGKNSEVINSKICVSSNSTDFNYKSRSGQNNLSQSLVNNGAFVTSNGMLIMIDNQDDNPDGLLITVDINGKSNRPNTYGIDVFTFEVIKDGEVLPLGAPGTTKKWSERPASNCQSVELSPDGSDGTGNNTTSTNGATCAFYAATNQNYFKSIYKGH